jgi:hypothetical protein
MLEVVEQEQRPPLAEIAPHDVVQGATLAFSQSERRGDCREHQRRIAQRRQVDEDDAIGEVIGQFFGNSHSEARLTGAAGAGQRDETYILSAQEIRDSGDEGSPAKKGSQGRGEAAQAPVCRWQKRQITGQVRMRQVEDPLHSLQVTQSDLAQVTKARAGREVVLDELRDGFCQQNLAAMSDAEKASQAVERRREVVAVAWLCFAGMEGHAHAEGTRRVRPGFGQEGALGLECCTQRVRGRRECSLRAVADRLVEGAAVLFRYRSEEGQVLSDYPAHGRTVALPERGAALDVG